MRTRTGVGVTFAVLVVFAGCLGGPAPSGTATPTATATTTATAVPGGGGVLSVHFINVGQATSTLVVTPTGETMLIDSGHYHDDGEYVLQYLQARGITHLDALVTSHSDADHIGGHAAVIAYFETQADGVDAVYDPGIVASSATYQDYLDAVERHDVTLYETHAGDRVELGGVETTVLSPPDTYLADRDRNENSLVLKVTHGRTSFLFTGDAAATAEGHLLANERAKLDSTVLKTGHHGSEHSSTGPFLDAVEPRIAVVSSARDSQYGHPNEETLRRLADRKVTTFWTATHGNVVFRTDGRTLTVATQRDAPTSPLDLRQGTAIDPGASEPVEPRLTLHGEDALTARPVSPTATPTPTMTDGGTGSDPAENLRIARVRADAAGDDRANLNDEYVVLENTGHSALDLSGWTISDEAGHTYTIPRGVTLDAGATLTVHSGTGTDTATDLYWGSAAPIWNNGGDTVVVRTATGITVIEHPY